MELYALVQHMAVTFARRADKVHSHTVSIWAIKTSNVFATPIQPKAYPM